MPAWRTPPQWDKPNHTKRSARLGFGMLAACGAGSMVAVRAVTSEVVSSITENITAKIAAN
jgi:hypothetical protein